MAKLRVTAQGVGDTKTQPEVDVVSPGLALRAPSPAHLTATLQPNGDTLISWIRRSRDGWRWVDGVDAPLAEEQEVYAITIAPSWGILRTVQTSAPSWIYPSSQRASDHAAGATSVMISISQIGTFQSSLPTSLTLSLS